MLGAFGFHKNRFEITRLFKEGFFIADVNLVRPEGDFFLTGAADDWMLGLIKNIAVPIFNPIQHKGFDPVAAIGKSGIAGHHVQRRRGKAAQGQRQVAGQLRLAKAKAGNVIDGVGDAGRAQQANGNQVARVVQGLAQAGRAVELAAVVGWPPGAFQCLIVKHDRGVIDDRGGGGAILQRGGIDKGLEVGAGLAIGLGYPVKAAVLVVETAHQTENGAGIGVHRDERCLHRWQL